MKINVVCEVICHIAMVGVCLILQGCSRDDLSDLQAYVAEVKRRPKGAIAALPEIQVVEPFTFRPHQVRDPFEPDESLQEPKEVRVETGIKPDTCGPARNWRHLNWMPCAWWGQ
jgi:Tfp pilus assembly protein PilP